MGVAVSYALCRVHTRSKNKKKTATFLIFSNTFSNLTLNLYRTSPLILILLFRKSFNNNASTYCLVGSLKSVESKNIFSCFGLTIQNRQPHFQADSHYKLVVFIQTFQYGPAVVNFLLFSITCGFFVLLFCCRSCLIGLV